MLAKSVSGVVKTVDGRAVEGVSVSDGFAVVQTDSEGAYQLMTAPQAIHIFITIPAGYSMGKAGGTPQFYQVLNTADDKAQTYDFYVQKTTSDEKHAMVAIGDPQVYKDRDVRVCDSYMEDLMQHVKTSLPGLPVHGMVLGDITGDKPALLNPVKELFARTSLPFFYVKGNHDLELGTRSHETASVLFQANFGPTYYSFNRGKIHYVVLDDVFYLGKGASYVGYLSEEVLAWLEQDLKFVSPGSTVVVALHIPTSTVSFRKNDAQQVLQNAAALYAILADYRVHIISGHTHLHDHHHPAPNIWEHTQASVSGIFWQGPECADGTPPGYTVYLADGDELSWYYKAIGSPVDIQFRTYPVGTNPERMEEITALVWNYDPHWKVVWYEDGIYMGDMENYVGRDPQTTADIVKNKSSYDYSWIWTTETNHLFAAKPKKVNSKIQIEVQDRFGKKYTTYVQHKKD
ncbi:calcineurin-like phosphoesterase C-terminal domain-containing protein [Sphingobacterium psychroaquaticum]|uniref:calcineurin-like phosphoesterase C-terminal domain-containing protein n=1 Tax=Sphingobacterium psychroaquaticum TaxID=561061 RepID=UPI00141AADDE|nr:calcineurin-like phosphoesterase family protein [Sphingobacterium psychroaquaticum]